MYTHIYDIHLYILVYPYTTHTSIHLYILVYPYMYTHLYLHTFIHTCMSILVHTLILCVPPLVGIHALTLLHVRTILSNRGNVYVCGQEHSLITYIKAVFWITICVIVQRWRKRECFLFGGFSVFLNSLAFLKVDILEQGGWPSLAVQMSQANSAF